MYSFLCFEILPEYSCWYSCLRLTLIVAFVNSMQIPRIGEFGRRHSGWTTVRSSSPKPGVYWAGRTVRR